jgi:hypothetical protein
MEKTKEQDKLRRSHVFIVVGISNPPITMHKNIVIAIALPSLSESSLCLPLCVAMTGLGYTREG